MLSGGTETVLLDADGADDAAEEADGAEDTADDAADDDASEVTEDAEPPESTSGWAMLASVPAAVKSVRPCRVMLARGISYTWLFFTAFNPDNAELARSCSFKPVSQKIYSGFPTSRDWKLETPPVLSLKLFV